MPDSARVGGEHVHAHVATRVFCLGAASQPPASRPPFEPPPRRVARALQRGADGAGGVACARGRGGLANPRGVVALEPGGGLQGRRRAGEWQHSGWSTRVGCGPHRREDPPRAALVAALAAVHAANELRQGDADKPRWARKRRPSTRQRPRGAARQSAFVDALSPAAGSSAHEEAAWPGALGDIPVVKGRVGGCVACRRCVPLLRRHHWL
mmetsp:Transcript_72551/g.209981  ORF Transcript_72551/g.209981 Transcript_72551/m.209981 type:complete len:210 (-) Transcript_72551:373-1002(-)